MQTALNRPTQIDTGEKIASPFNAADVTTLKVVAEPKISTTTFARRVSQDDEQPSEKSLVMGQWTHDELLDSSDVVILRWYEICL